MLKQPNLATGLQTHSGKGSARKDLRNEPLHLAIGMFDGVHLGHQAVIRQAMEAADKEAGHLAAVLTFDPHPSRILYPERATSLIMPLRQRIEHMLDVGADCVFVQPFSLTYSRQKAEEFVPFLMELFPGLKSIHVGENFRFGAGRSGDIDTLRQGAGEFGVLLEARQREVLHGVAISSSRIRAALMEGAIGEVNAMLGYPYVAEGRILKGKGMGRRIEFPTLNFQWHPEVLPRFGVYLVLLKVAGSDSLLPGVANYGLRPTLEEADEPLMEVHLLQPDSVPGAGDRVRIAMVDYLRPEKAFPSLDDLKQQIALDVEAARGKHQAMDASSINPF
ncbi:MAG: riboflavin biosynthesis protein RibF [Puniceicoccaceae bacterium]